MNSCAAAPTCQSSDYKFTNLDDVQPNTKYLGDASKANWVSQGNPIQFNDGVLLTMPANSPGTLLSSTHYVWYGKVSTTMSTSRGAGVVTAFILMSDVKDEIDFEFIGTDIQNVQSNFYWQGTLNYTNEKNLSAANTDSDIHTYTVDWSPDKLTWSVDNNVMRTLNKADTWNTSTNSFQYPQTPARIQFSLWPAGDPANGPGVVSWAGGAIDWSSPYMHNGYYSAFIQDVNVQCYDPPTGANTTGKVSYVYNDNKGTNNSIAITNDNTILASLEATGENPGVNPSPSASSGPSSTGGNVPVNTNAETVPGVSGGGARGTDGSASSSDGGSSGGSSGGSGGQNINGGTNGQFSQGNNQGSSGPGNKSNDAAGKGEKAVQSSLFAGLIAFVALIAS